MSATPSSGIVLVDYRAGNLTSVVKAIDSLGGKASITDEPEVVARAAKVVLPGVGHFSATRVLAESGLADAILSSIDQGAAFLGICVGLQWLFEGSAEAPETSGANVFSGRCERFITDLKVPHVGWNSLAVRPGSRLMKDVEDGSYAYFTHSYRAGLDNDTVAVTDYGGPFTAAIEKDNVMGVQFHPEKSGAVGLSILKNFLEL